MKAHGEARGRVGGLEHGSGDRVGPPEGANGSPALSAAAATG